MTRFGAPIIVDAPSNPILLAWTFAQRRRVQYALAHRGVAACFIVAFSVLAASIAVATWRLLRVHGAALLAPVQAHSFTLLIAAAVLGWVASARSRRRVELQLAQSWLASTPVSIRDRRVALRRRVGAEVLWPFAVILVLIAGAGVASATSIALLVEAATAGFVMGGVLGWRSGAKPSRNDRVALPRLRQSRIATSCGASVAALGRWPFAQLRAAANPTLEVRLLGALLLSLPMGIPPLIVLLLLGVAAVVIAALSLLRASLVMIPEAADWLHATPLNLATFVRACLRAVALQVMFAAVGGALIVGLGAPKALAFALSSGWLGVCVTALASAFACRHHRVRLKFELVGIGALLLAVAGFAPYALMLVLPVVWVWQATRARNA